MPYLRGSASSGKQSNQSNMNKETAVVMSCREHDTPGTWRINLKWQGHHEISDFDLDRLGAVQSAKAETDHSGYVIVKSNTNPNIGDTILSRN
jgi:hypothetical protein